MEEDDDEEDPAWMDEEPNNDLGLLKQTFGISGQP